MITLATPPAVLVRHRCGHTEPWHLDLTRQADWDARRTLERELCPACLWPATLAYVDHVAALPLDAHRALVGGQPYTWEPLD